MPAGPCLPEADNGISLIQVAGASTQNAFTLPGGYVTGGTRFQYQLNAYGPTSPNGPADPSQSLVGSGAHWDYRLHRRRDTNRARVAARGMSLTLERRTNHEGIPKAAELIEITGAHALEASDRAILNLLYQHAHDSGRLGDPAACWGLPHHCPASVETQRHRPHSR